MRTSVLLVRYMNYSSLSADDHMTFTLSLEPSDSRCSDFIIDEGEECDSGPSAILRGGDLYCLMDCTFNTSSRGERYNCRLVS